VADEVTAATEKTPDEIQRDMLHTRESLTEKVEALENQVVGTVEAVKAFVTTAPETVTDTVKQAAAAVSESVKETFDISAHIRRHPLAAEKEAGFLISNDCCHGGSLGGTSCFASSFTSGERREIATGITRRGIRDAGRQGEATRP
jgi:hypothetical protein